MVQSNRVGSRRRKYVRSTVLVLADNSNEADMVNVDIAMVASIMYTLSVPTASLCSTFAIGRVSMTSSVLLVPVNTTPIKRNTLTIYGTADIYDKLSTTDYPPSLVFSG